MAAFTSGDGARSGGGLCRFRLSDKGAGVLYEGVDAAGGSHRFGTGSLEGSVTGLKQNLKVAYWWLCRAHQGGEHEQILVRRVLEIN